MHQIKKIFRNYPFAHRQHSHEGHCKLIHGHNWDFEVCLMSEELDENGFVYDFGRFGELKQWLAKTFDHTCLISKDDPQLAVLRMLDNTGLMDLVEVESCSSEGIAKVVYEQVQSYLQTQKNREPSFKKRDVQLLYVRVYEDDKNSAQYLGK